MRTLRSRLIAGLAVLLCLVLIPSVMLVWGVSRIDRFVEQERRVEKRLEAYQQLSVDAHRYFKQIGDIILLGKLTPYTDMTRDFEILLANVDGLKRGEAAPAPGTPEMVLLDEIDQVLTDSYAIFKDLQIVETWEEIGRGWKMLSKMLDENIDRKFRRLLGEATDMRRDELERLRAEHKRLGWSLLTTSVLVGLLSIIAAFGIGAMLFRSIRGPLARLQAGTGAVGRGDLNHRIQVEAPTEFADLAGSFNAMTSQLAEQQEKIMASHANLEQTVAERTHELREANSRLELADQSRRRLFLDIGHELRTPLTVIQGEAEVTLRDKSATLETCRRTLERVTELTRQVTKLVNDLFLLARTELDPEELELQTVDLKPVLADVSDDAVVLAEGEGKTFEFELPRQSLPMIGDPYRLKQAFLALVDNAIRYSDNGGRIAIDTRTVDQFAETAITDYGIGIADEDLTHIFDRFYRGQGAKRHTDQGSGLGLTVAKRIIDAHGGSIRVQSKLGRGTTFTVRLPLTEQLTETGSISAQA